MTLLYENFHIKSMNYPQTHWNFLSIYLIQEIIQFSYWKSVCVKTADKDCSYSDERRLGSFISDKSSLKNHPDSGGSLSACK